MLPNERSATIPVYLAYVEELRHSKRICAFRDFVLEEISMHRRSLNDLPEIDPSHASAP